ncbi:MAG: hypothetical protein ABJB76_09415 [Candidatus Nitrosocosmicus sp.]
MSLLKRNMFVAERVLSKVVEEYGRHLVSTYSGTWYPSACQFLKITPHIHSSYDNSVIERIIQYTISFILYKKNSNVLNYGFFLRCTEPD